MSFVQIGKVMIGGMVGLAPMAGVTDRAFRQLCFDYGAAFVVGEMVSAKGLTYGDRKSAELLTLDEQCRPAAIQLFGDGPAIMAQAAEMAEQYKPDWIDINFGCPAPKITGNHCGSALLKEPKLCEKIVAAVRAAASLPVTVKIRKGFSRQDDRAVEVALACEAGGASAITVHGRTREQMYAPPADWDVIRRVKQAVSVPVIGNGDVTDAKSAAAMLEQTGCDGIMVGRGALGKPWVFSQINAYLSHGVLLPEPKAAQRMTVLLHHAAAMMQNKGEKVAMLQIRKHAAWYMNGMRGAAAYRRQASQVTDMADLEQLCFEVVRAMEREEGETQI